MSVALQFTEVTKRHKGAPKPALNALSFAVPTGALCGFVGPNGAGKTTTFSMVGGFLAPDSGELRILGEVGFDPWRLKRRLGVLPQDAALPERHTPTELLVHLARLQGMSGKGARVEAGRLLELVRLDDRKDARIGGLSHGMRRRVAVASALLGNPELVLLDEPMAGLDPLQARSLRAALAQLRGQVTLVVSSHDLHELERLCDHVVLLDKGECLAQGPTAEVTGQGVRMVWTLGGPIPIDTLTELLPAHRLSVEQGVLLQEAPTEQALDEASILVARTLANAGCVIREVRRGRSLEDAFVGRVGESSGARREG